MSFDKLLEYQRIDKELLDMENNLAKSEERQRYMQLSNQVKTAQETIKKLQANMARIQNEYAAVKRELDGIKEELDGFDGILEDTRDPVEMGHYLKKVEEQAEKLAQLDKSVVAYAVEIDKINDSYKKIWAQGVKATADQKAAKADFDALMNKERPRANEIQQQLKELAAQIPPALMEQYKSVRAMRKFPVAVPYDVKNCNCGGCRMELANDARSKLKNPGDYTECPNCRRIIYVPGE